LKHHILEIWDIFYDIFFVGLNIFAKSPECPEFVKQVTRLLQGDDIVKAFRKYAENKDCCVSRAQLTAHWFYVDEEQIDIELFGYSEMIS
jgi:hypothetical protein